MSYQNQILGTIISSMLNYDQFCKVIGENPAVNDGTSSYAPCDGRGISGSTLQHDYAITNTPDLRGRFLRGLNTIYSPGQPVLIPATADEDDPSSNRKAGDYQGDIFKLH